MEYLFPMALAVLLDVVKNPAKRATLKRQFAKLVKTILVAYGSDREFLDLAEIPYD
jgi:hypothetical protein